MDSTHVNHPSSPNTSAMEIDASTSFIACIFNGSQQVTCGVPTPECPVQRVTTPLAQNINLHTPIYDPDTKEQTLFKLNCFFILMAHPRNIPASAAMEHSTSETASSNASSNNKNSTTSSEYVVSTDVEIDLLGTIQSVLPHAVRGRILVDGVPYEIGVIYRAAHPVLVNYLIDHYPKEIIVEVMLESCSSSGAASGGGSSSSTFPSGRNLPMPLCESPPFSQPAQEGFVSQGTTGEGHLHAQPTKPISACSGEEKLVADIYDILSADRYGGSIASTHLQSSVMHSPGYHEAMEHHGGRWHDFLRSHANYFYVFKYTSEDIRKHRFVHTCHANEARVALVERRNWTLRADRSRELRRSEVEQQVFQHLHALLLQYGECDSHFILCELERRCAAFAEITHPSYHVLERIIRMNEGTTFSVRDEPKKGLYISLK